MPHRRVCTGATRRHREKTPGRPSALAGGAFSRKPCHGRCAPNLGAAQQALRASRRESDLKSCRRAMLQRRSLPRACGCGGCGGQGQAAQSSQRGDRRSSSVPALPSDSAASLRPTRRRLAKFVLCRARDPAEKPGCCAAVRLLFRLGRPKASHEEGLKRLAGLRRGKVARAGQPVAGACRRGQAATSLPTDPRGLMLRGSLARLHPAQ